MAGNNAELSQLMKQHRHWQRTLNMAGDVLAPVLQSEVVLWKSQKLQWRAKVLSRDGDNVEILQLGKNKKTRTVKTDTIIFSVFAAKNSELLLAFREARDMVDKQ